MVVVKVSSIMLVVLESLWGEDVSLRTYARSHKSFDDHFGIQCPAHAATERVLAIEELLSLNLVELNLDGVAFTTDNGIFNWLRLQRFDSTYKKITMSILNRGFHVWETIVQPQWGRFTLQKQDNDAPSGSDIIKVFAATHGRALEVCKYITLREHGFRECEILEEGVTESLELCKWKTLHDVHWIKVAMGESRPMVNPPPRKEGFPKLLFSWRKIGFGRSSCESSVVSASQSWKVAELDGCWWLNSTLDADEAGS